MKYRFRAHETFFIRKGWLNKGIKNVLNDPYVFMGVKANPMDILGIGSNMVKSLRYWLQAVGLTYEPDSGKKCQHLTRLGEIINKYDPYLEEVGTLLLLHYRLATNEEEATSWYYFFNEFKLNEFTKDDFIIHIKNYTRLRYDEEISIRSLEDDFNCIINTYVPRIKTNPERVDPENIIDCPFGELGLIDIVDKKRKVYKKSMPKKGTLHPLILFAVILEQANGQEEIKITTIQNEYKNAGKIFNLNIVELTNLLYKLELLGYIKVIRTAGLDVIRVNNNLNFFDCVEKYYQTINNTAMGDNSYV